jgi:glycosyltransferase involved in cell wall biosynthesis
LRIGVDATCWANGRGYGRFAREIMRELFRQCPDDEFICFGDDRAFKAWQPQGRNIRLETVRQSVSPTTAAAADSNRSVSDMLSLTSAVRRAAPDAFFSPSVYTYYPLPLGLPAVVTIHDTIAEQYPELTLPSWKARTFWNLKVKLAIAQSRIVLTVSEYSARSIAKVLRVPSSRIRVCVEAPAREYQPATRSGIDAAVRSLGLEPGVPYFVYVGGFNPHKRVDLILRAHATLAREATPAPHLVLVGTRTADVFHGEGDRLDAIIRESGTDALVHWTGFVPDEKLVPILSGAVASLLPSEIEGFGLPAVEAAACGTPVIATTESPLPELLEGGGIFVHPGDLDQLTAAMRRMLSDADGRGAMAQCALQRARALSWERGAAVVRQALAEAVGSRAT